ncbi:hypothetical protein V0288_19805 [Pannus brasiliensis CCIBt3594]|uniref:HMA domain-containing protein n=1 Tax=Pannus brasiliensis CCIBt3594 TaxID=1427578 RepID=A0AAW9QNL5_9CHRO
MAENLSPSLEIVSNLPGRIRFRFPRRFETSIEPEQLKKRLLSLEGITEIRINALSRSIVVNFRPDKLTPDRVKEHINAVFQELSPPKKANVPPVVEEIVSPTVTEEIQPIPEAIGEKVSPPETEETSPIPAKISEPERILETVIPAIGEKISHHRGEETPPIPEKISEPERSLETVVPAIAIGESKRETIEHKIALEPLLNFCREQAETIEKLEEQRQELSVNARIGSYWLQKWHRYSPATVDSPPDTFFLAVSIDRLEKVTDWPKFARQQTETIELLQKQIAGLYSLAAIGSARLNRWRR